jgi:hypothetical protein
LFQHWFGVVSAHFQSPERARERTVKAMRSLVISRFSFSRPTVSIPFQSCCSTFRDCLCFSLVSRTFRAMKKHIKTRLSFNTVSCLFRACLCFISFSFQFQFNCINAVRQIWNSSETESTASQSVRFFHRCFTVVSALI